MTFQNTGTKVLRLDGLEEGGTFIDKPAGMLLPDGAVQVGMASRCIGRCGL
jgi:hypothetical protein